MPKRKASELGLELSEVALKQAIDDGILKDIPVVGSIAKLIDIGGSIRDRIYAAKVHKFVTALNEAPEVVKQKFRQHVIENPEETKVLVEKLLTSIAQFTDSAKSEIVANLFLAYLDKRLTQKEFRLAIDTTNNSFLDDLQNFLKGNGFYGFKQRTYNELESDGLAGLVNTRLIDIDQTSSKELREDGWGDDADGIKYESSAFGSAYQKAFHHGAAVRSKHGG